MSELIRVSPKDARRFWSRVTKSNAPDGCWDWDHYREGSPAVFWLDGKNRTASRVAAYLTWGCGPRRSRLRRVAAWSPVSRPITASPANRGSGRLRSRRGTS